MRARQIIVRILVAAGFIAASGGILYAWDTDDVYVGTLWAVFGVALMTASLVYSLAMDDPESRAKMLGTDVHVDRRSDIDVVDVRDDLTPRVDAYAPSDHARV